MDGSTPRGLLGLIPASAKLHEVDVRVALALFLLAFLTFAFFVQGGGPNQNSRYDLTRAVVERHSLSIDAFHQNTFDKSRVGERHYSDKAPGLSFAAVPAHAAFYAVVGAPVDPESQRNGMYLATLSTVSLASALAVAALYLLLRYWKSTRFAAVVTVVSWAAGSHALAYSTLFVAHQMVASCLVISYALIVWQTALCPAAAEWRLAAAGALAGWAAISEYPAAPIAAGLFVYALIRVGWRLTLPFAVAAAVPLGALAAYNAACFGSPVSLGYQHLAAPGFRNVIDRGFFGMGAPDLGVTVRLLAGEFRGLLPLSPVFVLCPLGWVLMARERVRRVDVALTVGFTLYLLLLASSYQRWDGGAAMGPRYLLPALPFAAIPIAFAIDAGARGTRGLAGPLRVGAVLLAGSSVLLCTLVTLVLPELPDVDPTRSAPSAPDALDPSRPIRRLVVPLAADGLVSQKALAPRGTLGLAASQPGHDDDAFNWGEALGLRGVWSGLPLVLLWGLGLGLTRRMVQRSSARQPAHEVSRPSTPA